MIALSAGRSDTGRRYPLTNLASNAYTRRDRRPLAKSGSMGYEGNEAGDRANHIRKGVHHRIGIVLLCRHWLR